MGEFKNILAYQQELKLLLPDGNFMMPLSDNKHPLYVYGINNPTAKPPLDLEEMININNKAYAVRTFNIVCVDCDLDKAGEDISEEYRNTLTQRTGGGGKHYIFKRDIRMKNWKNLAGITPYKCDIKIGPNSYFVGNGSISKKGNYKIITPIKPIRMPDSLFNIINVCMGTSKKPTTKNYPPTSMEELRAIVAQVPLDKLVNYNDWMDIGRIIYSVTKEMVGCELWWNKSIQAPDYKATPFKTCKRKWKSFSDESYKGPKKTIGTLKMWITQAGLTIPEIKTLPDITNADIAQIIYKKYGMNFICVTAYRDVKPNDIYYFNKNIWTRGASCHFNNYISSLYNTYLEDFPPINKQHFSKLTSESFRVGCWRVFMNILKLSQKDILWNYGEELKDYMQFKNGAYNLRTQDFRPRTCEDFVTITLPYNYIPKDEIDVDMDIISKIFKQMQPTKEQLNGLLNWYGYCMTGCTGEQKFMFALGYTACNGKSTLFQIFCNAFNIYFRKISNDTFGVKVKNRDKSLSCLLEKPYRCLGLEDVGGEQNYQLLKDFVDGSGINVKPLYQEEVFIPIHSKLNFSGNAEFESINDNGIQRRGLCCSFDSTFVEDANQVDVNNHCYLKDMNTALQFKQPKYAIALFHFMTKYINNYYEKGFEYPISFTTMFKDGLADTDELGLWRDEYYERPDPKKEDKKEHYITRHDIMTKIKLNDNIKLYSWKQVKAKFKEKGYEYLSQERRTSEDGYTKKGIFVNIVKKLPTTTPSSPPSPFSARSSAPS